MRRHPEPQVHRRERGARRDAALLRRALHGADLGGGGHAIPAGGVAGRPRLREGQPRGGGRRHSRRAGHAGRDRWAMLLTACARLHGPCSSAHHRDASVCSTGMDFETLRILRSQCSGAADASTFDKPLSRSELHADAQHTEHKESL